MTRDEIVSTLQEKGLDDIVELIEDAEKGELEELELVESLGLLYEEDLNREVLKLLQGLGVTITYVSEEDFDDEEEEEQ